MAKLNHSSVKPNKAMLIAALLHWIITFFSDRIIFVYSLTDFSSVVSSVKTAEAWGIKLVFLFFLLFLYQIIGRTVRGVLNREEKLCSYLRFAGIYFCVMFVFFLMAYPGIWRHDEFGILSQAAGFNPVFWQNYLTSVFYIFSLMLVPVPAAVVFMQIVINSLITGYILYKCREQFGRSRWVYWMYLPFLLFPVIDSNLYPMRMSVYAFLELFLLARLLFFKLEKRRFKKSDYLAFGLLGAVVCVWRSEAVYYMLWFPIVFLVLFWKETDRREKLLFSVSVICCSILLFLPQAAGNKLTAGDNYEITSLVLPIVPLIEKADEENQAELIEVVDQVLDVGIIREGARNGWNGIQIFWNNSDLIRKEYTKEEYSEFKSAYYSLIVKYPFVFLKERFDTFLHSDGLLMDSTQLFSSMENENYINFRSQYAGNGPIFEKLRSRVISVLECRSFEDYNQLTFWYGIVWNFFFPAAILVLTVFWLLFKRRFGYAFLLGSAAAKLPLIFLTAPSRLFMYYYSVYLIGNVLFVYIIFLLFLNKERRAKS